MPPTPPRHSQAQQSTALSTFDSELTALVLLIKNLLALRRLGAFVLDASLSTSVVHCNNMSAIMRLHRRDLPARARHIHTNLGFVYDATDDGGIVDKQVRTMKIPTSTFTAAGNRDRFRASVTRLSGHTAKTHVYKQKTRIYKQAPVHMRVRALCSLRGSTTHTSNIPQLFNGMHHTHTKTPSGTEHKTRK